jgi:hypothetical protein
MPPKVLVEQAAEPSLMFALLIGLVAGMWNTTSYVAWALW